MGCSPRLYVYPLPDGYRRISALVNISQDHVLDHMQGLPTLSAVHMHGLGHVVYQRALRYRCRTMDPSKAEIFFVPAFGTFQSNVPPRHKSFCAERRAGSSSSEVFYQTALFERLERAAPNALHARGGADHLLLSPRLGASWELHPLCERCPLGK